MFALSAGPLGGEPMNGMQRYIDGVLDRFVRDEPGAVVLAGADAVVERWPGRVRPVPLPAYSRAGTAGHLSRLVWHQTGLAAQIRRWGARAYYSPVPEGMFRPACPQVLTVHDLLPLRYPDHYPRLSHYYRSVLPHMLKRCAAVVAVSHATAEDVRERFGLRDVPIYVVHQGPRADLFRPAAAGAAVPPAVAELGDFALAVSEARPYKNFHRLMEAMARVETPGLRLAVVGGMPDDGGVLRGLPARLGIAERVVFLGRVSDAELAVLYRAARVMVVPSLWEGFGIPAVEAMASACPLAVSRVASLPEVCGDAAVYFDPRDVDDIARAVDRVGGDDSLRGELSRRALRRARSFCAERGAARVVEIVRAAARGDAARGAHAETAAADRVS